MNKLSGPNCPKPIQNPISKKPFEYPPVNIIATTNLKNKPPRTTEWQIWGVWPAPGSFQKSGGRNPPPFKRVPGPRGRPEPQNRSSPGPGMVVVLTSNPKPYLKKSDRKMLGVGGRGGAASPHEVPFASLRNHANRPLPPKK